MILTSDRQVESNFGDLESHKVTIAANGKAFTTLVRGIYENKIAAFVREISTNAFDSHIEAGISDEPFRVELPDTLDPYFRVRDYGVSMTHDQVFQVFGTLFESTKDQSNDVVGAFGLGSKSPLAYADSFEVTAYLNGQRRTYLVSIDATGTPVLTLLSDGPCTDPDGIEVAVPIAPTDFGRVTEEARKILPGFDVMPQVVGAEIEPMDIIETVSNAWVVKADSGRQVRIRMGCVMYPVNDYELTRSVTMKLNYGYGIILNVPIGGVGVTTSREALELTPDTIENLKDEIEEVMSDLEIKVNEKFENCESKLEAVKLFCEDGVAEFWSPGVTYRDQKLSEWLHLKTDGARAPELPRVRSGRKRDSSTLTMMRWPNVKRARFVYGDRKAIKRASLRYREFCNSNGEDHTYWLTNPTPKVMERMVRLLGCTKENFVWVGNLPDPGPTKRGDRKATKGTPQGVRKLDRHGYSDISEFPDDYYWVERSRPGRYEAYSDTEKIDIVKMIGGEDIPVLSFTSTARKRYKPSDDRNLDKLCPELIAKHVEDNFEAYVSNDVWLKLPSPVDNLFGERDSVCETIKRLVGHETHAKVSEKAQERVGEILAKYPMLSNQPDIADIEAYIKLCDEAD